MTPYDEYFLPISLLGCFVAAIASIFAGRTSGCVVPGVLLCVGILAVWIGVFLGTELGYRAWQSMPDAPAEAFNDTSAVGALLLGWFPGLVFCMMVFCLVRGFRWVARWANPDAYLEETPTPSKPVETGNPYQGPNSG